MKIKTLVFLISLFIFLQSGVVARAQTTQDFVFQTAKIKNVAGTEDLQSILEKEVKKIIDSGHLAPFRTLYGEGVGTSGQFVYYNRHDSIYTLSLIYPYVSASTQTQIKTYLQSELQNYPPTASGFLNAQQGAKRQPDELSTNLWGSIPSEYSKRPKLFALYTLWLYAHNTGDWNYINNNWTAIKNFYSGNSSEISKFYTSMAGAIGYARMAEQKSPKDTAARDAAVTALGSAFTSGKNYAGFASTAETAFEFASGEWWQYTRNNTFMGFQFIDITPEIGRYFNSDSSLKNAILGSSTSDIYTLARAEYINPFWYLAQGPAWNTYYGEGSGNHPDARAMIFPLKAWVQKEPAAKLRQYLDTPDALVGDLYYLQNIVRTIEAHGQTCWLDIRTNQEVTCEQAPNLPSPTPTTNTCPADITGDRFIDLSDFGIIFANFGKSNPTNPKADINGDGIVDLSDFSVIYANFGKSCS